MSIKITFEVETVGEAKALLDQIYPVQAVNSPSVSVPNVGGSEEQTTTQTTDSPTDVVVGASVKAYAAENNVNLEAISGTGKNGRITKADVTAAIKAAAKPPVPTPPADDNFGFDDDESEESTDDWDDDDDEPATPDAPAPVTLETARESLRALQKKLKERYIAQGKDAVEAGKKAQLKAHKVMTEATGIETLGALLPQHYGPLVDRVAKALATL